MFRLTPVMFHWIHSMYFCLNLLLFRYSSVTLYQKNWLLTRAIGKSFSPDCLELSRNIMNLKGTLLRRTVWDDDSDMLPDNGG